MAAAPSELRAFIDALFEAGKPLEEYNCTWQGDRAIKLEHKGNNACLACCAPGCHQDLIFTVALDDLAWLVTDTHAESLQSRGPVWKSKTATSPPRHTSWLRRRLIRTMHIVAAASMRPSLER